MSDLFAKKFPFRHLLPRPASFPSRPTTYTTQQKGGAPTKQWRTYQQKTVVAKKQHFFASKCLTGEKLSGNILEQLRRAIAKVLTTVEIIGNESNFVE